MQLYLTSSFYEIVVNLIGTLVLHAKVSVILAHRSYLFGGHCLRFFAILGVLPLPEDIVAIQCHTRWLLACCRLFRTDFFIVLIAG